MMFLLYFIPQSHLKHQNFKKSVIFFLIYSVYELLGLLILSFLRHELCLGHDLLKV